MTDDMAISIAFHTLDQMMPMHLLINDAARITHAGPTIVKVLGGELVGRSAFSLFELRRPRVVRSMEHVRELGGAKVHLRLKDGSGTNMVGAFAVMPGTNLVLLNLSFGYSMVDAVARYQLAGSDFAPTDLTVEMLYLMEAKTAAMTATTKLAHRLHGEKAEAQVEAMTDGLTGLRNRRAFDATLKRYIGTRSQFSLMHIDLDFFKTVNDTLGHAAGDAVLREVAQVLSNMTRDGDMVARVGGDEFIILLNRLTDENRLESLARRIILRLEHPVDFAGKACQISASIGIVRSSDYAAPDAAQMIADADLALYMSKGKGRACMTIFRPEVCPPAQIT
ncbi:GGDEF domain-containing protein [Aliiroseovarius sediminis]|uniref:GGDEF domain-containing protein n=1 Tax=Aliiroseovarius sediminis TaxID=2925839 RepID=UPI001F56B8C9|nr:GGDEF domain-containing protein [Aliiroseovarius sediminis]MCI2393057.1 GGDEF domain-containing protein [Aliiroseovarius sediminis]